MCHHVWTVPLIVLVCVFVLLCEVISGVLFAVDHLTASFTLNSFLCNSLADPVTYDWLQLLALKGFTGAEIQSGVQVHVFRCSVSSSCHILQLSLTLCK